jgi:DNA helicase-2/ATP-dependent DNA helicase PcrA
LPKNKQTIISNDVEAPVRDALQHFWETRHAPIGVQQPSLRELVLPRLEDFQLSATHLNAFTDLVYAGPDAFFMNTVLRFPKAPTADGQYGNAIHETLEAMHLALRRESELPEVDEAITIFTEKLRAKRLSENDFRRQHGRGMLALAEFLPQWWHNFTPEAESEKDFKHEGSFVGDAHLSGKLDQILVDIETKKIRVVDFKTGKSHSRWTQDVKMHKYRQQLLFYKLLVEASHSYKNYEVEQGILVFVEPDDSGKINELSLSYTTDDLDRTKKLINAVWHRIKKLDLPDVSNYSKDLKGVIAFEDWLIDNDML